MNKIDIIELRQKALTFQANYQQFSKSIDQQPQTVVGTYAASQSEQYKILMQGLRNRVLEKFSDSLDFDQACTNASEITQRILEKFDENYLPLWVKSDVERGLIDGTLKSMNEYNEIRIQLLKKVYAIHLYVEHLFRAKKPISQWDKESANPSPTFLVS